MKNLFNVSFKENRLVFMNPPEKMGGGTERMSSHEAKKLDGKLNRLTRKFDGIQPRHVKPIMKSILKKNLESSIINALKKKLNPYNQAEANQLFAMMYPPKKLKPILRKAKQKMQRVKFNITNENIKNIRVSSKTRFADLLSKECGIRDTDGPTISTGSDRPWQNLGSKLASKTSPSKLRAAVKKSRELAKKAVTNATKDEMGQQVVSQIRNIIRSVA